MKKTKPKSEQKTSKKDAKKDAKKIARKELGSNLSAKFKEVIQSLGHEAEVIAKDIEKAGKFLSKKLSDKKVKVKKDAASSSLIKTLDSAIEQVKEKKSETAGQESQAVTKDTRPKQEGTRRRSTAAKAEAPEKAPEKETKTVRRTAATKSQTSPASTARNTKKVNATTAEEAKTSSDSMAQDEETKE